MRIYRMSVAAALMLVTLLPCGAAPSPRDTARGKDKLLRDTLKRGNEALQYTDEFLDTVNVSKTLSLNDYTTIGVHYGVSWGQTSFNPPRKQMLTFFPDNVGITWTRYGKMFGYMPYFGLQADLSYGHSAYRFKPDKETGYIANVEGATQALFKETDLALLALMHYDMLHFKLMASVGIYGGRRLSVERIGEFVDESLVNDFKDTDRLFDYGLKGGVGFGIVFDPFELHFNAMVRYAWSSLYQPDYYSPYYYRFAYPYDIIFSAGLHFQLTRRTGKTKPQLRKEAYEIVYGSPEFNKIIEGDDQDEELDKELDEDNDGDAEKPAGGKKGKKGKKGKVKENGNETEQVSEPEEDNGGQGR